MKVSEIMTRRVVSVGPDDTILQAVHLMLKHHVSGLPVVDDEGKLVGIVTEGDFLRRSETGTERKRWRWLDVFLGHADAAKSYVHSHGLKIREVMTGNVVTVGPRDPLDKVVHVMESHNIKRVPVVSRGKMVGIVSRANLMRALASLHHAVHAASKDDSAIRDRILADIGQQDWSAGADVDVVVRDGLADLWGTIVDAEQREALKVLAENVPGVSRVVDHLRWQDETAPT